MPSVLRTFVLATIAVPIVIYGLMPYLHRLRARLVNRNGRRLTCGSDLASRRFDRKAGSTDGS